MAVLCCPQAPTREGGLNLSQEQAHVATGAWGQVLDSFLSMRRQQVGRMAFEQSQHPETLEAGGPGGRGESGCNGNPSKDGAPGHPLG